MCRNNNLNLAKYWFTKTNEIHLNLPENILVFLNILYIPSVAFYHYKNDDFKSALDLLTQEIKNTDVLLNNNKLLKTEFKLEQLINKYRILYQSKDYKNSILLASKIINFIINNKSFGEVINDDIEIIKKENFDNYMSWVSFLINSIIIKIEYDEKLTKKQKLNIYYEIFRDIEKNENEEYKYLTNSFLSIKYYHENNFQCFLNHVLLSFEKIYSLPTYLQIILLNILRENNKTNIELYENYITKVLKVKSMN